MWSETSLGDRFLLSASWAQNRDGIRPQIHLGRSKTFGERQFDYGNDYLILFSDATADTVGDERSPNVVGNTVGWKKLMHWERCQWSPQRWTRNSSEKKKRWEERFGRRRKREESREFHIYLQLNLEIDDSTSDSHQHFSVDSFDFYASFG